MAVVYSITSNVRLYLVYTYTHNDWAYNAHEWHHKDSTNRIATRCSCLSKLCGVTSEPVSSSYTYIKYKNHTFLNSYPVSSSKPWVKCIWKGYSQGWSLQSHLSFRACPFPHYHSVVKEHWDNQYPINLLRRQTHTLAETARNNEVIYSHSAQRIMARWESTMHIPHTHTVFPA